MASGRQPAIVIMAGHREAERILAIRAPKPWWTQRYTWTVEDNEKLKILAAAGADLDRSALALGRSAEALVWYARKLGIVIPAEWAKRVLIKGHSEAVPKSRQRARK